VGALCVNDACSRMGPLLHVTWWNTNCLMHKQHACLVAGLLCTPAHLLSLPPPPPRAAVISLSKEPRPAAKTALVKYAR
jgi:hypothetical protein